MKLAFALFNLAFLPVLLASNEVPEIEEGFEHVTCGSTIKLTNKASGYKLHSHGVTYGSGSGQQSVTCFPNTDDANSFWIIEAASGKSCKRGEIVPCGSSIRLRHPNTQGYLHSHQHQSPLSRQQEVSCYDGKDTGDNWRVECLTGDKKSWLREEPVQLLHEDTSAYLSSSTNYQFGQPIPGQLEVAASKSASKNTQWMAQEGVYFAAK
ncbi:MIR motif-containing protein [Gilbertella persicaria]|uniref:Stromal cell-derived factor 2-like protein 1 n=1 Tax=Rhizopus stolonifer TaxID=4846 RepID=A0A367ILA3_RHIST|nr:MIR motif-containing protein [Gilbertella persicaria]KAI8078029.1 MIR motif-containing protein [Gilbertella persicaria]RCH78449.1 Stromal cell-derived factor 2-like protein 1 [Rhizopus stolonifer]